MTVPDKQDLLNIIDEYKKRVDEDQKIIEKQKAKITELEQQIADLRSTVEGFFTGGLL